MYNYHYKSTIQRKRFYYNTVIVIKTFLFIFVSQYCFDFSCQIIGSESENNKYSIMNFPFSFLLLQLHINGIPNIYIQYPLGLFLLLLELFCHQVSKDWRSNKQSIYYRTSHKIYPKSSYLFHYLFPAVSIGFETTPPTRNTGCGIYLFKCTVIPMLLTMVLRHISNLLLAISNTKYCQKKILLDVHFVHFYIEYLGNGLFTCCDFKIQMAIYFRRNALLVSMGHQYQWSQSCSLVVSVHRKKAILDKGYFRVTMYISTFY